MDEQADSELAINASEMNYFRSNPPPAFLDPYRKLAKNFITGHLHANRNVVLVTSGGTTVPLENQTVRFIDNFSAGTRGATSAEYFLEAGYAVIFLHRQFSLLPYSRHYSHSTNCFLDFMVDGGDNQVVVSQEYQSQMMDVLRKYNAARRDNKLLLLPFTSVSEYLWELQDIAQLMRPLGPKALFYLAAAVSDFFLPRDRISEHKIQSSDIDKVDHSLANEATTSDTKSQKLLIDLDPIPKFLKTLVDGWAPEGMIVSFKLETDPSLLISKAQQSLRKYSHHLVIGNLLSSRKFEVVFVAPNMEEKWIKVPLHRRIPSRTNTLAGLTALREFKTTDDVVSEQEIISAEPGVEIESLIVPEVVKMHRAFLSISERDHQEAEEDLLAKALAWADSGNPDWESKNGQ